MITNTNNSIMVIHPYKENNVWMFDDSSRELAKEALVAGIPEIIEFFIGDKDKFTAIFSASPFPGYQHKLNWVRPECGGNIYQHEDTGKEGWLCPSLLKYFNEAPETIYIQIK
jgi:hypothetical protein